MPGKAGSGRSGSLQNFHNRSDTLASPEIQDILIRRTNTPGEHIMTIADSLVLAGYISFTVGGIFLALIMGVDIFDPHIYTHLNPSGIIIIVSSSKRLYLNKFFSRSTIDRLIDYWLNCYKKKR